MTEEEQANYDKYIKPTEEAFQRTIKKWEALSIGDTVKVPYMTYVYSAIPQFKEGVIVDKQPPVQLLISIDGEVKSYTASMVTPTSK